MKEMPSDLWLPKGYTLADGEKLQKLLIGGEEWQIYKTAVPGSALVVKDRLAEKWFVEQIIEREIFKQVEFDQYFLYILTSNYDHVLSPVDALRSPIDKTDALAFAIALRETRKILKDTPLHDSIYVERYSRLLPTWSISVPQEDKVVLGTWISGGVVISTDSFRRLTHLVKWIAPEDLKDVISAGLPTVPPLEEEEPTSDREKGAVCLDKRSGLDSSAKTFALAGRHELENFFLDHVIDIIQNDEKYKKLGIDFPSGIVLYGPPGSGKTYAVERLIEFLDWPSFSINSNTVGSPFIHETSKKVSEVFDKAIKEAPSIVVIDEMESFLSDRKFNANANSYRVEEVAEFLRRIPDAINRHVLVIGMTNMIELIDPGILRRGRFDHVVEVGMPSKEEVEDLLSELLRKLPVEENIDLFVLVDFLVGRPISDSAYVVREAARLAGKERKCQIDQACLLSAIKNLPEKKEPGRGVGFVWK